jgi:hypothetical protein
VNVLEATWRAMRAALGRLRVTPGVVLVDGHLRIPGIAWPQRAIVGGDRRCASVAALDLAKVARDAVMIRAERHYPGHGCRHKGHATAAHLTPSPGRPLRRTGRARQSGPRTIPRATTAARAAASSSGRGPPFGISSSMVTSTTVARAPARRA